MESSNSIDSIDTEASNDGLFEAVPKTTKGSPQIKFSKQKTIPFGLVTDQTSQPHFQVIEYAETHWRRSANLYVIKIPDKVLINVHPIRFANILCRSRRFTYCLEGGIDQWRAWVDYWCNKPIGQFTDLNPGSRGSGDIDNGGGGRADQKFNNQRIKNLSVPIFAYTKCGITPDKLCKGQVDAVEKQLGNVRISEHSPSSAPRKPSYKAADRSLFGDESAQDSWEVANSRLIESSKNARPTIPADTDSPPDITEDDLLREMLPPAKRRKHRLKTKHSSDDEAGIDGDGVSSSLASSSSQIPTLGPFDEGSNMSIPFSSLRTSQNLKHNGIGETGAEDEDAMTDY
jgi:hypothetical protein